MNPGCSVALTFELDLNSVEMNQRGKYLGQVKWHLVQQIGQETVLNRLKIG